MSQLDAFESAGDSLAACGEHEKASDEYKRALFLLGSERNTRRSSLYVKLGECARALGRSRVALNNFDKALAIDPASERAYRAFVDIALAERDFALIDELIQRRLSMLTNPERKIELYRENFRLWGELGQDTERALEALERWLGFDPTNREALEHKALLERALSRFGEAIASLERLAECCSSEEASRFLSDAAKLALEELEDRAQAVQLYTRATVADPDALEAALAAEPRLTVEVKRERRFYEDQSRALSTFLSILGITLSVIFSLGAMIGAAITMYAAVATRTAEIGTLRALGFRRRAVLTAFLLESLLLALVGGAVGLGAASFLQTLTISTTNFQTFSELAFSFALTPRIVVNSLIFALVMGFVGGFLPAIKASRMKIVDALRAA